MPLWLLWEKNSEGYTLFPLLNKGEEEWGYTLFPLLNKEEEEWGGYTLFPLLNKGEEEWGVHSLVGVHPLVSGTLSLGRYLLHGRKSCRLQQPSDEVFT